MAMVQENYFFLKHIKKLKLSKPFGETEYLNKGSRKAYNLAGCMQLGQLNPKLSVTQESKSTFSNAWY